METENSPTKESSLLKFVGSQQMMMLLKAPIDPLASQLSLRPTQQERMIETEGSSNLDSWKQKMSSLKGLITS